MSDQPKAWLKKRKVMGGVKWGVRWIDPETGRQQLKTWGSKALAKRMLARKFEELAARAAGDPIDKSWTAFVDEELDLAQGRMARASRARLRAALNALTRLCDPPSVGSVSHAMLEAFISRRAQEPALRQATHGDDAKARQAARQRPCSLATVNGDLSYIRASLNRARRRGYITTVPELPKINVPDGAVRWLAPDEVERLVAACRDDRELAFVWLSLTCGTRRQETLHLRWRDVDMAAGYLRIRRQAGVAPGDEAWIPKGRKDRVAHLLPPARAALEALWAATPKRIEGGIITPRVPWVFVSDDGRRWGTNIERSWGWLIKRAGIEDATIHDMRRTFVTGLVAAGVQQSIVTATAGHASVSTTYKYYTAVPSDVAREAVHRLPFLPKDDQADEATESEVG